MRQAEHAKTSLPRRVAPWRNRLGTGLVLPAALILSGCGRTLSSTDLVGFGSADAALERQAEFNFVEAPRIARVAVVDRFVRSPAVCLTEAPFPPAVPTDVAAAWRGAMLDLERYCLMLEMLSDSAQGKQTTEAFKRLGVEPNSGAIGAGISPGVAAGFASLAGSLVQIHSEGRAREILRQTDPRVRQLLTPMSEAVGSTDGTGLRGAVGSAWTASTGELQRAYAVAAIEGNEARKRSIAYDYLAALDRRQAQLNALSSFRQSLLALADAHTAAANGSRRPVGELLTIVEGRLDEVQGLAKGIGKERDDD